MLVSSLGISGVFFISAITSVLGALFTFFFIPRTKDKSMYELEMLFTKTDKIPKDLNAFELFDSKLIMKSEENSTGISCGSMEEKENTMSTYTAG